MTLRPLLVPALLICLPLTACGDASRGIETAHQPVVARDSYVIDLFAGPEGLASGEAQRLRGWLETLSTGYGDSVALDDATVSPGVRADVAAIARGFGLPLGRTVAAGALPPGTVRVSLTRSSASVPSCTSSAANTSLVNFDAHTSSGFGCAVNGNLAAMVADPADLVRGKIDDGSGAAATGAKAVSARRRAIPTGTGGTVLKSETTGAR